MATIEEMLNALEDPNIKKMSPNEFWQKLSEGLKWDDMDFDNKEEFDQFLEDNPYDSI